MLIGMHTNRRRTLLRALLCYALLFAMASPVLTHSRMFALVGVCILIGAAWTGLMCYLYGRSEGYADGHVAGHAAGRRVVPLPIPQQRTVRRALDWTRLNLPAPIDGLGYIYVVGYTSGLIKVGQSRTPRKRLRAHRSHGAVFGVDVVDAWVSPPHRNYTQNEVRLIKFCQRKGKATSNEYFRDVGFAVAVEAAEALEFHGAAAGVGR